MSYWIDFGFSFLEPSTVSWRFPIALQILFALIILIFIMGLPESPRWLIMKGKEDEALNVLCALNDKDSEDPYIVSEFAAIKDSAMVMQQGGFRDLFTMDEDRNFHRVVLAYVNQCFQQISGINLITYYAANIYENSIGLSGFLSRILAAANGTEYFAASWIAVFTIEKFGRRQLMLFGAAGQAASMAILAGATSRTSSGLGITAAVFLFVFNTFFAIGWLGMTWLYPVSQIYISVCNKDHQKTPSALHQAGRLMLWCTQNPTEKRANFPPSFRPRLSLFVSELLPMPWLPLLIGFSTSWS